MPRTIWILGAAGYVGSALTQHLLAHHPDMVLTTVAHRNLPFRQLESTNLITGSLEDFDLSWLERFPPEVVFHCARLAGSNDAARRKAAARGRRANERLRKALAALPAPPVVVYCSGTLMYGNAGHITESAALNPIAYARHYLEAELPWIQGPDDGLDVRMARPAWIAGPDSWFDHFFYRPARQRGVVPCYGDGRQRMSLIHIDDCAGMLDHVWSAGAKGHDYNLATCAALTQADFAERLAAKMKCRVELLPREALVELHGATVAEALCSDLVADTEHGAWKAAYTPRHPDADAVIESVLQGLSADALKV